MNFAIAIAIALGLPVAALALPPALRERSVKRFLLALGAVVLGVIVPPAVFLLSALLAPEWKGACPHGWIDAFHLGKLALTPLVLWATAALYASDVLQLGRPVRPWVRMGLVGGALVSLPCLLFGISTFGLEPRLRWFLIVPAYTSAWYAWSAARRLRAGGDRREAGRTLLASAPFWIGSLVWSYSSWRTLPDNPPECFVVTAASRGHRRVYNRWGPVLARRITSPWRADVACLALRPVEWLASLWLAAGSPPARRNGPQVG